MINKSYWDEFYKLNLAPKKESKFAEFVLNFIQEHYLNKERFIDIGCGNGRDTFYFDKNGIDATGIDISVKPKAQNPKFIQDDIRLHDYSAYNLIYARFIFHALREENLDILLNSLHLSMKDSAYVFVETRSSKGVTDEIKSETYFKSAVGKEHFRMLYSKDYLSKKLEKSFEIIYVEENTGFSAINGLDPVCTRYILKKKKV